MAKDVLLEADEVLDVVLVDEDHPLRIRATCMGGAYDEKAIVPVKDAEGRRNPNANPNGWVPCGTVVTFKLTAPRSQVSLPACSECGNGSFCEEVLDG